MTFLTWLRFLCGNKQAIRDIAHCPQALWLGLLFVLSAGIAREYDGEDLLHDPYFLLIPPLASLVTSIALYGIARLLINHAPEGCGTQPTGYRGFLACYWMTGPLAWIYAIPVERWMSEGEALNANLRLLAFVAVWRVILMVRVVKTLFVTNLQRASASVFLFSISTVTLVSWNMEMPIYYLMGGVRLTDSELAVRNAVVSARLLTLLLCPVASTWYLAALWFRSQADIATVHEISVNSIEDHSEVKAVRYEKPLTPENAACDSRLNWPRVSLTLWMFAASFYLAGAWLLAWAQPEQRLRYRVERLARVGRIVEALSVMSEHQPSDFPPHWRPPPRTAYGQRKPTSWKVFEAALHQDSSSWVINFARDRFFRDLGDNEWSVLMYFDRLESPEEAIRLLKFIDDQSPPEGFSRETLREGVIRYIRNVESSQHRSGNVPKETIDWLIQYVERGSKKREATPQSDNADPMRVD